MRSLLLCSLAIAAGAAVLRAQETASIPTADGFQCPVGSNGSGEGYYIARGYRANGHLGDDWNGVKGGDTDLGDPVYATAHGIVVFAKNYHVGWGNVVILRHAFYEGMSLRVIDSLYGHLNDFNVREGQQVKRGQLIGHIGNNNGMYDAHLHFEMRKNLNIGMYRGSFPRDGSNYYEPNQFIAAHLTCPSGGRTASVPINTFPATAPPSYVAAKVDTPVYSPGTAPASHRPPAAIGSLRLSRDSSPRLQVTPTPKVAAAPDPTPKPASTPAPKTAATASSSTTAPARTATVATSSAKAPVTPSPARKETKTASSSGKAPASPTPSTKSATTASAKAPATPPSAAKSSTTASARKPSTPPPSTRTATTVKTTPSPSKGATTAKTAAPPSPSKSTTAASARTTAPSAKPATTASAKTPAATPIPKKDTTVAKAPPTEAAPPKTAKAEPKTALNADAYEPAAPAPATGSPIRRSQPSFRVDRFQDLRGMGY